MTSGGDTLKRVMRGSRLNIPAATWNLLLEVAEAHKQGALGIGGKRDLLRAESGLLYIKNMSGSDLDRLEVLGIDSVLFSPGDNEKQFLDMAVLTGSTPDVDVHLGKFAVLAEPIKNGKVGRAWVHGVFPVKMSMLDSEHEFADVKDGETDYLESCVTGGVQILFYDSTTASNYALVRSAVGPFDRYVVIANSKDNYTSVFEDAKDDSTGYQQFYLDNTDGVQYNVFVHSDTPFGTDYRRLIADLTLSHKKVLEVICSATGGSPGNVTVRLCMRPVTTDWTPDGLTWNLAYDTVGLGFGEELYWTLVAGLSTDNSPWETELIKWPSLAAVDAMNSWDALGAIYGWEFYIEVDATNANYAVTYNPTLADTGVTAYGILHG